MSDPTANLDLSVLPPAYRAAFEELRTLVQRQDALLGRAEGDFRNVLGVYQFNARILFTDAVAAITGVEEG